MTADLQSAVQRALSAWDTTTLKTNGDGMLSEAMESLRAEFDCSVQAPAEGDATLTEEQIDRFIPERIGVRNWGKPEQADLFNRGQVRDAIRTAIASQPNVQPKAAEVDAAPWSKTVESAALLLQRCTGLELQDCENLAGTILGMAANVQPKGTAADHATVEQWEAALSAVMPADFKDWWQNSRSEWPAVAAGVIESQRADRDMGWEMAAKAAQAPAPVAEKVERPCRTDGRCQYAIDVGAEGMGSCSPRCIMPPEPKATRYSIDADPDGIRARVAFAITGALGLGAQNESPPPEGHWLSEYWQTGRQLDEWRSTLWAVARVLNCLPSTFSDANGHVFRAAEKLMAQLAAQAPRSRGRRRTRRREVSPLARSR